MFWNKKDGNKGLPDLPPLKVPMKPGFEFPDFEEESENTPLGLPSPHNTSNNFNNTNNVTNNTSNSMPNLFPSSPINTKNNEDSPPITENPFSNREITKIKTMEMEEWTPKENSSIHEESSEQEIQQPKQSPVYNAPPRKREEKTTSEVFVKIEKFNSARRALNSIKQKLEDVDVLLKKVRETKLREEQELSSWEKELSAIKSRIQDVNTNIFE